MSVEPSASAAVPTPVPDGPGGGVSPTPATVGLALPSEASTATPQGASAFARHYLQALTIAYHEANSSPLRALSDPGCGGCNNFISAIEGSRASGERTRGGVFKVEFAEAPPIEDSETLVELRYSRTAGTIVDEHGDVGVTLPADPSVDAQMRLLYTPSGWRVLGFRATPT